MNLNNNIPLFKEPSNIIFHYVKFFLGPGGRYGSAVLMIDGLQLGLDLN